MDKISFLWKILVVGTFVLITAGCSVTTREVGSDEQVIYDEGYHFSDKKAIVDDMVTSLLSKHPLLRATDRPVLIVYGISNNDEMFWDNSQASALGYRPQDNAESFREKVEAATPESDPMDIATIYCGGSYPAGGHFED